MLLLNEYLHGQILYTVRRVVALLGCLVVWPVKSIMGRSVHAVLIGFCVNVRSVLTTD